MNISWNPVLNKFVEIKQAFVEKYGEWHLWEYDHEEETCLQYWVKMLGREDYADLIFPLKMNEYDGKLNLHYGSPEMLYSNYDMTGFWDKYDGFYRECRGVVLDIRNDKLLLTPFKKFMNMNECEENSLENILQEIEHADIIEISEKLDGSMISGRCVNNVFLLASSSQVDPEKCVQLSESYNLLTDNHRQAMAYNPNWTFVYELIAPDVDPHIVDYSSKEKGLYLIGIRDVVTGIELPYYVVKEVASMFHLPVTHCEYGSVIKFHQLINSLGTKKSDEAEGFVINVDGHRFKLKYDDYCLMHRAMASLSGSSILEVIAENRYDDFYAKVPPAFKPRCDAIAKQIITYDRLVCEEVGLVAETVKYLPVKEAMIWIDNHTSKPVTGLAKCQYLGRPWNPLGTKRGEQYVGRPKMTDIDRYLEQHAKEIDQYYSNTNTSLVVELEERI